MYNHAERGWIGNHDAVPANRSCIAPAVAWLAFLIALTGVVAGANVGGMPQHVAPSQPLGGARLAAPATTFEVDAVHGVPHEIGVLIEAHEAALAALAWRMPGTMCH